MTMISVVDYNRPFAEKLGAPARMDAPVGTTHEILARGDADWELAEQIAGAVGTVLDRRVVKGHALGIPGAQSGEDFLIQFVRQRGTAGAAHCVPRPRGCPHCRNERQ